MPITTCGPRVLVAKTCNYCGELKMAREFRAINGPYYASKCTSCNNLTSRPKLVANQQKSLSASVKRHSVWTDRELDSLLQMAERGLSGPEMALQLGRSVYSVYNMKQKLMKEAQCDTA